MIKHTVQDQLHASFMQLFYQFDEQLIAGFQICQPRHSPDVPPGFRVIQLAFIQQPSLVFHDFPIVGVHVIVVLDIVFVIGWRYENRIQI